MDDDLQTVELVLGKMTDREAALFFERTVDELNTTVHMFVVFPLDPRRWHIHDPPPLPELSCCSSSALIQPLS